MKRWMWVAASLALCRCAALEESVVNHAVDATGNAAGNAINKTGDKATDSALNSANSNSSSNKPASNPPPNQGASNSTQQASSNMVLFPDSGSYLLGVVLGQPGADGSTTVLHIVDGTKTPMTDFIKVRPLTPGDAKLGADVFYTTEADPRRGHYSKGSITNVIGTQKVDVGVASGLDMGKQVWVAQ